ncbi:MAG: PilC/PilY family type IV pilus protein, partial [Pseudoxanthomonas sp.]
MTPRRTKFLCLSAAVLLASGGYFLYSVFANQGQGTLAQAPLNIQSQVTPGFMMAIDDSGSTMFQNQFPGADGKACWNRDSSSAPYSFFYTSGTDSGKLRTSGGTCDFAYAYGSHYRLDDDAANNWVGIPPVDSFGFARSPEFNPAYFNPSVTYEPWLNSAGVSYGDATPTAARIDPSGNVGTWTVDLTQPVSQARMAANNGQLSDKFRALTGMVLPSGTNYYVNAATCGGLTGLAWRTLTAAHTMTGNCDIFVTHYLPTFYLKQATAIPAGYGAVARTLVNNACGPGCNMYRYTIAAGDTAAMRNFANWFSYYGNRHKSLVAGLTRTMFDVNNMRVGYFRISQHGSRDEPLTKTAERVTMYNMAVPTDKTALYTQVLTAPSWGSTFNRQAVYAAGEQFRRTDTGAPVQLACQKNATMLFTDGYSNSDGPTVGNLDLPMGVPFRDSNSDTMADIASKYYLNDAGGNSPLRTDLPAGQVPTPGACPSADLSVDCQENLHVNFYGITLNGRGNLFDPDTAQNAYTNATVYNNWPARQNDNRSTIDDIWHAATNTRGKLVNARTPADIIAAMRQILGAVGEGTTPAGSIGLTGARIGTGSFVVEPFYEARNYSTDWYSTLTAKKVTKNATTGAVVYTTDWEAAAELPTPANRNVWYAKGTAVARFNNAAALTLADLCSSPTPMSLCTQARITSDIGVNISQAIDYLLGDQSNEEGRGGTGKLRFRSTRLGDIVNSSPVISNPLDDYGYRTLRNGASTDIFGYQTYLTTKSSRRPMVYAGANDGMLHAFDGRDRASGGGVERFGYIPTTALGHMGNLLFPLAGKENDPDFQHRYYVDGPVTISDAYNAGAWAGSAGWKTVLVGGAGAGGRGVYALNVSNPAGFTSTDRLWEINANHATASVKNNIGYVINKPVIVPVKTYGGTVRWKAIFGNGYASTNKAAVLFVVDIATGAVTTITATEAAAPAGGDNGLGNIVVLDRFGGADATLNSSLRDGYADTVYGADQKGAVWKFDLRDGTSGTITTPLFVTNTYADGTRQPILGGLAAAAGPGGGVMVYFGTGSFSFAGDEVDRTIQSLY